MTYEDLLIESEDNGLIVREKSLKAYRGRIKGNRIAIKKELNYTDKKCTLVEELGHYYTTSGNILDQSKVENRKQELKARRWGYERLVPLDSIICAYKHGCRCRYQTAQYIEVTEQFLEDTIAYYLQKYGICIEVGKYIIYFDPLGVMEKY